VPPNGPSRPLLELVGLTKRFGDLTANDDVSLSVASGEVVAMLGENGAGKSTLMKMVYGLYRPDAGTISLGGEPLDIGSPRDAMAAGIGMVTQEFSLVETMTVAENIALSGIGLGHVRASTLRQRVLETMDRVGVHLDPERLVATLSIGERQRVEIVKALFHECRVLILDEPTAVLPPQDVRALFATIARLRGTGLGVLFVSHKLREVAEISDRVVVLRRGRLVGERVTAQVGDVELASLMMGLATDTGDATAVAQTAVAIDPADADVNASAGVEPEAGLPVLQIRELSMTRDGRQMLHEVTLAVHAGEIVGVAGISGNGQSDLVEVLCGMAAPSHGSVVVDGVDVTNADTATRLAVGLGRLTEDRKGSIVPGMSVEYNLVLEDLPAYSRRGLLDRGAIRRNAEAMIEEYDIRARPASAMSTLSGGNIQKVLLARALSRAPRVLVVAQPTRGLDSGAYRYVHHQLAALRDRGAGVLVISEDLDELRALCRRIAVLFRGEIVGELPVSEATGERLGIMMTGATAVPA
jgi:simple sugar transport system ATP-binding protein